MTGENNTFRDARDSLSLKLPEPIVSSSEPWRDDVLDRQQLGERLTSLIRTQVAPFTISIHGDWGTGKTFLLKRWQKDLEKESFKAIYFNAWEDDFCDDPLLAMLGQLADYFSESALSSLTKKIVDVGIPLLRQNVLGILNKSTGITLDVGPIKQKALVDEYLEQRATKDELKSHLSRLSEAVADETHHPMVFIIDELDRCRPNFAIELLERVKHIFDVPNIVFVFGISREQLCISLQAEYGQIDADTYLRRFFDIEFNLPDVDRTVYCRYVMDKFQLNDFFSSLSADAENKMHLEEFRGLHEGLPRIAARLGLSLRDIDYCVGSIAVLGKWLQMRHRMYPAVLGLLIPLKLKNSELYRRFIRRRCLASEVIDYIDEASDQRRIDGEDLWWLGHLEAYLYLAEVPGHHFTIDTPTATKQLELLASGAKLNAPEYLSKRLRSGDQTRLRNVWGIVQAERSQLRNYSDGIISNLGELIDLHQDLVRR